MCFGRRKTDEPEAKKSREIEKQLREDERRQQREVKMLLLGTPVMIATKGGGAPGAEKWTRDTDEDQARESRASRRC